MRELAGITIHTKLENMKKFARPITCSNTLRKHLTLYIVNKHTAADITTYKSNNIP